MTYAQPPLHERRAEPRIPGAASIQCEPTSAAVVVRVHGVLDADAGACLLAEVEQAATAQPPRIEIDLGALDGFTPEGAAALAACKAFQGRCQGGLHYRTLDGPGRQAFLAAFK